MKKEAEKSQNQRETVLCERLDQLLLALKMEEGTTRQGMQVASKSWKEQGSRFSTRYPRKECSPADTLNLIQ